MRGDRRPAGAVAEVGGLAGIAGQPLHEIGEAITVDVAEDAGGAAGGVGEGRVWS